MRKIEIPLPWKSYGHDGCYYPARLTITLCYGNTKEDEVRKLFQRRIIFQDKVAEKRLAKKQKSGLRKCPGHKYGATYDDNNQCSKCGGFKVSE